MESLKRHTTGSDFDVAHLDKLPKVGIVYSYSNVEADIMTPFLNNGYQGIVHAGVGNTYGGCRLDCIVTVVDALRLQSEFSEHVCS